MTSEIKNDEHKNRGYSLCAREEAALRMRLVERDVREYLKNRNLTHSEKWFSLDPNLFYYLDSDPNSQEYFVELQDWLNVQMGDVFGKITVRFLKHVYYIDNADMLNLLGISSRMRDLEFIDKKFPWQEKSVQKPMKPEQRDLQLCRIGYIEKYMDNSQFRPSISLFTDDKSDYKIIANQVYLQEINSFSELDFCMSDEPQFEFGIGDCVICFDDLGIGVPLPNFGAVKYSDSEPQSIEIFTKRQFMDWFDPEFDLDDLMQRFSKGDYGDIDETMFRY